MMDAPTEGETREQSETAVKPSETEVKPGETEVKPVSAVSDGDFVEDGKHSLYVSKLDAGIALLLSDSHHLIEFPAQLLPSSTSAGSILNVHIQRNFDAEKQRLQEFMRAQAQLMTRYGKWPPAPPLLVTTTLTSFMVVLELRGDTEQGGRAIDWADRFTVTKFEVLRNGKLLQGGAVLVWIDPNRRQEPRIKLSMLEPNTEYQVKVILWTTSGRLESQLVKFRTRPESDLTGLNVRIVGYPIDGDAYREIVTWLTQLGAKHSQELSIENTHLIYQRTSNSKTDSPVYDRAAEWNIPIVSHQWLKQCYDAKKSISTTDYYVRKASISP